MKTIIDRCNLTILVDPAYEWLADFLTTHRLKIVASMPCYAPENVNAQRGMVSLMRAFGRFNSQTAWVADDKTTLSSTLFIIPTARFYLRIRQSWNQTLSAN